MGKAAQNIGIPIVEDCNDADAPVCGYSTFEHAIDKNGERVSAMSAYLSKKVALERRDHLTVCTGTIASRLEISGDDETGRTVTGVHIKPSSGLNPAKDYFVKARREVILTCGAITTPQLLLLSGIGPTGPNSSMPRLNIPLVKELPAVGANFSDHYSMPIMLELPPNETVSILESALWGLWYILLWTFTGRGRIGLGSAPGAIFLHTDAIDEKFMTVKAQGVGEKEKVPNVEIMFIPSNSFPRVMPGRSMFTLYPTVIQPKAKGQYPTHRQRNAGH
jgi:choline dehydrogenase-like flavoprotein